MHSAAMHFPQKKKNGEGVCVLPLIIMFLALVVYPLEPVQVTTADVISRDNKMTCFLHFFFIRKIITFESLKQTTPGIIFTIISHHKSTLLAHDSYSGF